MKEEGKREGDNDSRKKSGGILRANVEKKGHRALSKECGY